MKTRATLKREKANTIRALNECLTGRTEVHERLAAAESERESARALSKIDRLARENAEREHGEAVARAVAARAEAAANREKLEETIGQRDEWAKTAEANARDRRDAQRERDSAQEDARVLAERLKLAQDALQGSEESRLMCEQALAAAQQERDDARAALTMVRAERDARRVVVDDRGVNAILMPCATMGEHMGHPWWPRADKVPGGKQMHWCDGRNADGTTPYDPVRIVDRIAAENAAIGRDPSRMYDQEGEDIGPRIMPEGFSGVPIPWAPGYTYAPAEPESVSEHDDHPGPAGAERLRFEDAAFDAMRDALLAITGTEPYDPDAVADKLRLALGMMDSSGHHVREGRFGTVARTADRTLVEHWQRVAKRLERRHDALAADNRVLTDRANEATTRAAHLATALAAVMGERDEAMDDREEAHAALRQVKAERDELRPLAGLRDPVVAQDRIVKATERMHRAEAEFDNLRRERDAAIDRATNAESDLHSANASWTKAVQGVRREVGEMQRERDAWSERAETHEEERDRALSERDTAISERDEARGWLARVNEVLGDHRGSAAFVDDAVERVVQMLHDAVRRENEAVDALQQVNAGQVVPLALLADAQSDLREATRAWESATRKLVDERDKLAAALAECRAESAARERERADAVDGARQAARDSMIMDGALENALGKLAGVVGVEHESPAFLVDLAMDAIKDARREAGRLKLVLDIIDERKATQPIEVERRHDDPDNTGQCIRCGVVLDSHDSDYDERAASAACGSGS